MNLSKKKKIMLAVGTVLFLAVVCGFVAVMAIGGNREGNAQEQLSLGERYLAEMDYERAVAAFEMAIELEPRNIDAYIGLFEAYEGLGNTDLALEALETAREKIQELVREGEALPDSAAEVYLMLVHMYEEAGNYEEARLLLEEALSVTDSAELQEIWEAYMPEVEFSLAAGEYEEGTELTLTTDGQAVYYTLDGSDPVQEGEGTAEVVIVLQEGNWTIRAAAEGRGGTLGDVIEVEYVVAAAESMEETEETEPESVESTEEETEPESESMEVMELDPEETEEEIRATISVGITEVVAQYIRGSSDMSWDTIREMPVDITEEIPLDMMRNVYWAGDILYPMGTRDISGIITVIDYDTNDVLGEKNLNFNDVGFGEIIEIEVPFRRGDEYLITISVEGYLNDSVKLSVRSNLMDVKFALIPEDISLSNVVEVRFLDKTGNLIYPDRYEWCYRSEKDEFVGEGILHDVSNSDWWLEGSLYVRYVDGITIGVRLWNDTIYANDIIYPITPDQSGVSYITLSDFDMENMGYRYR